MEDTNIGALAKKVEELDRNTEEIHMVLAAHVEVLQWLVSEACKKDPAIRSELRKKVDTFFW
jgi:hypothetical protein